MVINDEKIKKDVVDQLYWDGRVDASDVKVVVSDGVVTLTGTLPTLSASMAAVEDTEDVAGVCSVKNDLMVKIAKAVTVPNDDKIKTTIETVLGWNLNINSTDIDVSVKSGLVTLQGTVPTYWEKTKAENIALEVFGAAMITNKLAVVPTRDYVDEAIAEDIIAAIDRNINIDVEWVNVKVEGNIVTLSGNVPNYRALRAAHNAAAYTLGVLDIINNLKIA